VLTQLSQRPTLGADLTRTHRHVTSRNQGTFSRKKERGPWERGWESSATSLLINSAAYITFHLTAENCSLQIQRKNKVMFCLLRPPVPTSHVLESPHVPHPSPHVPHPSPQVPVPKSQSPSPRPTFSDSQ